MEPSSARGGGRKPRRRGGRAGGREGGLQQQGVGGQPNQQRRKKRRRGAPRQNGTNGIDLMRNAVNDSHAILGRRVPQKRELGGEEGPPDAFALFSSFYLGVTGDDRYQTPNVENTAKRFRIPVPEIKDLLKENAIDEDRVKEADFDLEGALLDIRLAPEGISRTAIARDHFDLFVSSQET